MLCPGCNAHIPAGDEFCSRCGFDLRKVTTACPACGAPLIAGDAYCGACGAMSSKAAIPPVITEVRTENRPVLTEKPIYTVGEKTSYSADTGQTALDHGIVREIAAAYEYNLISPLRALNPLEKKAAKSAILVAGDVLAAILKPSKAFYLTSQTGSSLSQKILLVRGTTCCRWVDHDGTVMVGKERSARVFLDYIYNGIAGDIKGGEKSVVVLTREQILVLKAINSLCQALTGMKLRQDFTTFSHVERLLQAGAGLKGHLDALARAGMIRVTGSGDTIISLEVKGRGIIRILENYDVFYTMQVLWQGHDEFSSIYLVVSGGQLYLLSNPNNADDVLIRAICAADLRSMLNWMWIAASSR